MPVKKKKNKRIVLQNVCSVCIRVDRFVKTVLGFVLVLIVLFTKFFVGIDCRDLPLSFLYTNIRSSDKNPFVKKNKKKKIIW